METGSPRSEPSTRRRVLVTGRFNNVSNVHVLLLWLVGLHLGPCSVLSGTRLVRELSFSFLIAFSSMDTISQPLIKFRPP